MSEYQYYEFRTIDRELTQAEIKKMSTYSSRAEVTANSASYYYNWSDFPGNPVQLMKKHFDIMIYMANWGSRELMVKVPLSSLDTKTVKLYCTTDEIRLIPASSHIIVDLNFSPENMETWADGSGWLNRLSGLREGLIQGDYRALYLAWLKSLEISDEYEDVDLDSYEPPVPPGLSQLTGALKSFVSFLEIDKALLAAAAANSKNEEGSGNLAKWIIKLPNKEKDDFLLRLSRGETNLQAKLNRRLNELSTGEKSLKRKDAFAPRKISVLLDEAEKFRKRKAGKKTDKGRIKSKWKMEVG